jgi:hypothetical protein
MATLTLTAEPGFTDIPGTSFAAGAAVSDATMRSLNATAKFAVVRTEEFWGYYQHSEYIALPVSPADGYEYTREELIYVPSLWWSGAGPGSLDGTQARPLRGATSGPGLLLQVGYDVDQGTGLVSCDASYYVPGGTQTNTHDGILMVVTIAKRLR